MSVVLRIAKVLLILLVVVTIAWFGFLHWYWSRDNVLGYSRARWTAMQNIQPGMTRARVDQLLGKPAYVDDVTPRAGLLLSPTIESKRDEISQYTEYHNGIDNTYIVAFDANGLVVGKAYMFEGPPWENRFGTIRPRTPEE